MKHLLTALVLVTLFCSNALSEEYIIISDKIVGVNNDLYSRISELRFESTPSIFIQHPVSGIIGGCSQIILAKHASDFVEKVAPLYQIIDIRNICNHDIKEPFRHSDEDVARSVFNEKFENLKRNKGGSE